MYVIYTAVYVAFGAIYFSGDYIANVLKRLFGRDLVSHKQVIGVLYLLLGIVAFSNVLSNSDGSAPSYRLKQTPHYFHDHSPSSDDLIV